jgi:hypothetical protein
MAETDKPISVRCQNGLHRRCSDCGCECHIAFAPSRSVRVSNIQSPFYQWTGKLDERVAPERWRGSYSISTGLSLNLTFDESDLELMGI